jgi:hypothetical protein
VFAVAARFKISHEEKHPTKRWRSVLNLFAGCLTAEMEEQVESCLDHPELVACAFEAGGPAGGRQELVRRKGARRGPRPKDEKSAFVETPLHFVVDCGSV